METVVTGRHVQISNRFREHLEDKLAKVSQIAPRVQRVDIVVTHEPNRRQAKECDRVEITCRVRGAIIRAEACADDKYAAVDIALDKLLERLRRAGDRRRVHRGRHVPESVAQATARLAGGPSSANGSAGPAAEPPADSAEEESDSPIQVREKVHASRPMALDEALAEMELVGHDFYLFHDSETDRPSVVYRRRGWSYGVIHLDITDALAEQAG